MRSPNHALALGTVQFGLKYGVSNSKGKVPFDEVLAILERCRIEGISFLDTSRHYGDSEEVIGKAIAQLKAEKDFHICTKLDLQPDYKSFNRNKLKDEIFRCVDESRKALNVETIPSYLLHTYDYMLTERGYVWEVLNELKDNGSVGNIGISICGTTEEGFKALELESLSLLQIPFNVFDTRWIESGLLDACDQQNVSVVNRSTFLQGLLLMEIDQAIKKVPASNTYMQELHRIAEEAQRPIQELIFSYVLQEDRIGYTLIGVENLQQLEENIKLTELDKIEPETIQKIRSSFSDTPIELVNPAFWPSDTYETNRKGE
jgi:aryl-alcohol dehydrogenase-like predicted oxidoreductase